MDALSFFIPGYHIKVGKTVSGLLIYRDIFKLNFFQKSEGYYYKWGLVINFAMEIYQYNQN